MRWSYDATDQALYVTLRDDLTRAGVIEMPDGTIVDVDAAGQAVGVEVIRSWAEWDIDAVIRRFALDEDTASALRWIAYAPLVRSRPTHDGGAGPGQGFQPEPPVGVSGQTRPAPEFAAA